MSTIQYRQPPTYTQQIVDKGNTTTPYYRFFQDIHTGKPPAAEIPITVGASPFSYTAPLGGFLIVSGGTVSAIHFMRVTDYNTGQTSGTFPLSAADKLTITYSGVPTVVFVPQ